jgi:hypothetical protein
MVSTTVIAEATIAAPSPATTAGRLRDGWACACDVARCETACCMVIPFVDAATLTGDGRIVCDVAHVQKSTGAAIVIPGSAYSQAGTAVGDNARHERPAHHANHWLDTYRHETCCYRGR